MSNLGYTIFVEYDTRSNSDGGVKITLLVRISYSFVSAQTRSRQYVVPVDENSLLTPLRGGVFHNSYGSKIRTYRYFCSTHRCIL